MPFIRTVLGDIESTDLGVCYSHEHLIIDGGRPVEMEPDFRLDDVDCGVTELQAARQLGLRAAVDSMPCDAGRNVLKLAEISRRSGVHVVAPTGLHLAKYYDDLHWSRGASVDELATLFEADIRDGIDERDYSGPLVRRTEHRAGVIKVAGGRDQLNAYEEKLFRAAAAASRATGCPILTHCEAGTAGLAQVELLADQGVAPAHIVLSHVDRVVDRGYHRELFATGACLEYDSAFRWPLAAPNGTLQLLEWAFEDGNGEQVVLGMDAARRGYWTAYGGDPGLTFLLGPFAETMRTRGIGDAEQRQVFVTNPARVYSFI